jgi:undecaprenyl-diphosphatase
MFKGGDQESGSGSRFKRLAAHAFSDLNCSLFASCFALATLRLVGSTHHSSFIIPPMQLWQAVILGIVEGITEYLPVSSTGHLILVSSLLGLNVDEPTKAAVDAFNIVVQGGAILAVLGLYRARVWQMIRGVLGRDRDGRRLAVNILVAFAPAAVLGPFVHSRIERELFHAGPVLAALALGGVFMIALDRWRLRDRGDAPPTTNPTSNPPSNPTDDIANAPATATAAAVSEKGLTIDQLTWRGALIIGVMQAVAMWPGTSRSMMTITGGVIVGLRPKAAAEFSFLLGLITLGGACAYTLAKDIRDNGRPDTLLSLGLASVLVGILVATLSAAVAVKWLVAFLNRHGLEPFGWYRLALAAVLGGLWLAGAVTF